MPVATEGMFLDDTNNGIKLMNKRSMRSKKNDWPFALARIYKLS